MDLNKLFAEEWTNNDNKFEHLSVVWDCYHCVGVTDNTNGTYTVDIVVAQNGKTVFKIAYLVTKNIEAEMEWLNKKVKLLENECFNVEEHLVKAKRYSADKETRDMLSAVIEHRKEMFVGNKFYDIDLHIEH